MRAVMCGGGVSWVYRTQKCATLSTTEVVEHVALADVIKEALLLRQV